MDEAGIILPEESNLEEHPENEISETEMELDLSPLETLQRQLKKAVSEERYEDAAHLRDEIEKIAKSN